MSAGGPLDLLLERLADMEGRFVKLEKTRYWEKIPLLKVCAPAKRAHRLYSTLQPTSLTFFFRASAPNDTFTLLTRRPVAPRSKACTAPRASADRRPRRMPRLSPALAHRPH